MRLDATRLCSTDGCDAERLRRGMCRRHYLEAEFWKRVVKHDEGCWEWTGYVSSSGYPQFATHEYAHRFSLALATGESLEGLEVDHICHTPTCVRADHLRATTRKQNAENMVGARSDSKSGIRGVWFAPARDKWVGQVKHAGRRYSAGYHLTQEDAEAAVVALRNRLFTHNDADRRVA